MFSSVKSNLFTSTGIQPDPLDALARFEADSIKSISDISISEISSSSSSFSSHDSFIDKLGLRRRSSVVSSVSSDRNIDAPRESVTKVLRFVQKMINKNKQKMGIVVFMECLLTFYPEVSLCFIEEFMNKYRVLPKPDYFHYYFFFLHYAAYYHHQRSTTRVLDNAKIDFHKELIANIKIQLKFVYYFINRKKSQSQPSP